ncbi:MAG TPA: hypothetical protein VMU93_01775 [Caulobacteraceae bacterium]|nr:hypothetical protein [Caulobacteraceae bacterium]
MAGLDTLVGDIALGFIRGAVQKAVAGFVAKGELAHGDESALVEGVMLEIELALEVWRGSRAGAP